MGHDFRYFCHVEARKLLWLIATVFAMVVIVQYLELPYGNFMSSLFNIRNNQIVVVSSSDTVIAPSPYQMVTNLTVLDGSNISVIAQGPIGLEQEDDPEDESPSKDFTEAVKNYTRGEFNNPQYGVAPEVSMPAPMEGFGGSDATHGISPSPATAPAVSPTSSPLNISSPTNLYTSSLPPTIANHSTSSSDKVVVPVITKDKIQGPPLQSHDSSLRAERKKHERQTTAVLSISEMNTLFLKSRDTYHAMKPLWSSAVDQELLDAKTQIMNAKIVKDPNFYAPLYRNVSTFIRSYELMEQILKVYVYKEGKRPIFHGPPLKGIYASEGWFMKLLEANKHFVTKNANEAHLFYLPFSSRALEITLYVPDSHTHKNMIQFLKKYLDMIVVKYPFWNRTGGADHFLVACHDWAPAETREFLNTCIRALCNNDIKEGFQFGKDVSLPETYVRNPQNLLRDIGGKPPSNRPILAFFAGSMHGYLRPILLQHWQDKDPDIKVFAKMRKVKGKMNYIQYMKSSKYCICAKGYEVNSPRVVEAILYECVPVIISDNFVPPLFETLNWESFAVFILEKDIPDLKKILLSISKKRYFEMQRRVKKVQQHFLWHAKPEKYDMFHMILHSIWHNRVFSTNPG